MQADHFLPVRKKLAAPDIVTTFVDAAEARVQGRGNQRKLLSPPTPDAEIMKLIRTLIQRDTCRLHTASLFAMFYSYVSRQRHGSLACI